MLHKTGRFSKRMRGTQENFANVSLRERNKREKFERICAAASEIFVSQGFDNATLRSIAQRADVGLGTLFSYATDKRDLLFLINNGELRDMTEAAAAALDPEAPLGDVLLDLFARHYAFFKRQPELSRTMLRELNFYNDTEQATRFQETRDRALGIVRDAISNAKKRQTLPATVNEAHWAQLIFGIYQMELRAWLSGNRLDLKVGLARLRDSLILLAAGMGRPLWPSAPQGKPSTQRQAPPGTSQRDVTNVVRNSSSGTK